MKVSQVSLHNRTGFGLVGVLLLAACRAAVASPEAATAAVTPTIESPSQLPAGQITLDLHAIRLTASQVTYVALIKNPGEDSFGGLSLEVRLPQGAGEASIVGAPNQAQSSQESGRVSWSLAALPAHTLAGPFAVQIAFNGEPSRAEAVLRWDSPAPGETRSSAEPIEEATQSLVSIPMAATAPIDVLGTGVGYAVPFGDEGLADLSRLDSDPPAGTADGLVWLTAYEFDQGGTGSATFSVPLRQPAPPYTEVHVFADLGDGYIEQTISGTVADDGMHASFSTSGSGRYALGVDVAVRNLGMTEFEPARGGFLDSLVVEGLPMIDELMGVFDQFADLLQSLRTDGIVIIDNGDEWLVLPGTEGSGGDPPDSEPTGCATSGALVTCVERDGIGGMCDGHGGGVTTYGPGGNSHSTCADGSEVDAECVDGDDDGYCSFDDEDDDDPDVHFAPVPGPCPHGVCFMGDDPTQHYGVGQVDGLSTAILELIAAGGLSISERLTVDPPTVLEVQAPGSRLNAAALQAQVAMIDGAVVLFIPSDQPVHAVMAPPALVRAAGLPPAPLTPTPLPTSTPPTPIVIATTPAAKPPTPTNTPIVIATTPAAKPATPTNTPVPDTTGPSTKSVSDAPDPIKVTQPKGCTPATSTVTASITDPSGVASAYVLFFHTTIGQVPMSHGSGNTWSAVLGPYTGIGDGTVDYQVHATDGQGNASDSAFGQITVLACLK